MTKNLQTTSSTSSFTLSQKWQWQKRHWLLAIGLICLVLWFLTPSLKSSPVFQSFTSYLPVIGGLAFATDNLLKLTR